MQVKFQYRGEYYALQNNLNRRSNPCFDALIYILQHISNWFMVSMTIFDPAANKKQIKYK